MARVRTIPQRELRNNVSAILREAEAGTQFIITVRGRPVAKLRPFAETRESPGVSDSPGGDPVPRRSPT